MANFLLASLGGLLYSLGTPSVLSQHSLFGFPLIALTILFILWGRTRRFQERCVLLFVFSLVACLVGSYTPLAQIPSNSTWVKFFITPVLALSVMFTTFANFWIFMLLHLGLKPLFEKKVVPGKYTSSSKIGAPTRAIFFKADTIVLTFFIAGALTLLEFIIPQTLPNHIGFSWINLAPYLGLAPIFGLPLFSFLSYLLAGIISQRILSKTWDWPSLVLMSTLLLVNSLSGLTPKASVGKVTLREIQQAVQNGSENELQASLAPIFQHAPLSSLHFLFPSLPPVKTPTSSDALVYTRGRIPVLKLRSYEALFSENWNQQLRSMSERPKFLALQSSPQQTMIPFSQLTILNAWKAIEYQIPLVQFDTQQGATIFHPTGSIIQSGTQDIIVEIPLLRPSLYQRWGLLSFIGLWMLLLIAGWIYQRYTHAMRRPYSRTQLLS